jgi:acyl-coenzyme A synthetase/AMP-(fatty) acid ligase
MTVQSSLCFAEVGNLVDVIRSHAALAAGRAAIVDGDRIITYSELAERIARYAGFLQALGLRPKNRLALVMQDHADHLILILAAASLGAAALSINWRSRVEEKRAIAESLAVDLTIHDPDVRLPARQPATPLDDAWRRGAAQAVPLQPNPQARNLPFRILLTSGSTGTPKGVELTHAGIFGWCEIVREVLGLRTRQRHLSVSPLAFTGSLVFNLPQILLGNTVELFPSMYTIEELVAAIRTRGVTGCVAVPTILRQLLTFAPEQQRPLFPQLEYLVSLGAPLSADERRAARDLLTPFFYDNYGASGAGPITFLSPEDIPAHADTIGRAAPLREVQVVDEYDRPLPAGLPGRLRCRGVGVANRLCNGEVVSSDEMFREGWYYPGEIAWIDEDCFIHIVGRASELILRRGNNVYPAEIEAVLMQHPNVCEAAVIGAPVQGNDEEVIAFVRVSEPTAGRELLEICRRNLIHYKVPSSVRIMSEFPRTATGKVLKQELLRMFDSDHSGKPT